jgi:membrane protein DedA with SNARE-associated domain
MEDSPLMLTASIVLATFILEDAATAAAALLAAEGAISPPLALAALYGGIVVGDLALYGIGRLARRHPRAAEWIGQARIEQGRIWLDGRLTVAILTARFVPGLRLPAYAASGYLRVSFVHFAAVVAIAALLWTPALFFAVYIFGDAVLAQFGPWRYAAGVALVLAVVAGPWLWTRFGAAKP